MLATAFPARPTTNPYNLQVARDGGVNVTGSRLPTISIVLKYGSKRATAGCTGGGEPLVTMYVNISSLLRISVSPSL